MTDSFPTRCRVLVVDDCPDTTASLSLLLGIWGHDVRTAQNGKTALELAREYRPEVVFLDIGMPGMDGFEVAYRLRHDVQLTQALVVSLSGYGQKEYHQHALEVGCDYHLIKPVDPELLRRLLASHGLLRNASRPAK